MGTLLENLYRLYFSNFRLTNSFRGKDVIRKPRDLLCTSVSDTLQLCEDLPCKKTIYPAKKPRRAFFTSLDSFVCGKSAKKEAIRLSSLFTLPHSNALTESQSFYYTYTLSKLR
jgi:hypothetical protein